MQALLVLAILVIATLPLDAKTVNGTQYPKNATDAQIATDQKQKSKLNGRIDYDPDPFIQLMLRIDPYERRNGGSGQ